MESRAEVNASFSRTTCQISVHFQFKTLIGTDENEGDGSRLSHSACAAFVSTVRTLFFCWSHYF